jgi:perosamine synthetase
MSIMNIPFYKPMIGNYEKDYVNQALDEGWVSSRGRFVPEFENKFAEYVGTRYAVSTNTGTAACHIALLASHKVIYGDAPMKVIVSDLTFVATANAVKYCGGELVLSDVDFETWNLGRDIIEEDDVTHIFPVHLLGCPCDMDFLSEAYPDAIIVEDACEAFNSRLNNKFAGNLGHIACFSFFGNKYITTGEGGMITTNNKDFYEKALFLRGQAEVAQYYHTEIGHNYRMTNIAAAIGLAQLKRVSMIDQQKKDIMECYMNCLEGLPFATQQVVDGAKSNRWVVAILLTEYNLDELQTYLTRHGIETRRMFHPIHTLPHCQDGARAIYESSTSIYSRCLMLPSYPGLTEGDIFHICNLIKRFYQ